MSLMKNMPSVFVLAFLFVTVSAISVEESANDILRRFRMPENCQDAISRFPADLQNGFQGVYITFTGHMGQTGEYVFNQLVTFHILNYVKTNIILTGKGNEKEKAAMILIFNSIQLQGWQLYKLPQCIKWQYRFMAIPEAQIGAYGSLACRNGYKITRTFLLSYFLPVSYIVLRSLYRLRGMLTGLSSFKVWKSLAVLTL